MVPHKKARSQIARSLDRAIATRGISKSELARSARISRTTLDAILQAECGVTIDVLARLADELGINMAKLFAPSAGRGE